MPLPDSPPDTIAPAPATPPTSPAWTGWVDLTAGALAACALFVVVAGRGFIVGPWQFVLPSTAFFFFLSAATLGIRHAASPTPSVAATVRGWRARLAARPHASAAVRAFLVTRPLVFFVGYFAVVTFGFPKTAGDIFSNDPLGNLPARFDAGWYGGIALDGYQWDREFGRQKNIAFFPALPMLMRPVGAVIGMRYESLPRDKRMLRALWAGVFVSLAAFLWALVYISRLGDLLIDRQAGALAPLLLAAYPFAVFFNAPYTEALFLLGSAGAFYHFHRGQLVYASLFGLLAGFSRPNGCLVSIPLAILAVQPALTMLRAGAGMSASTWLRPLLTRLLAASMPGVAMLLFTAYLYRLTGIWLVWARVHEAWGRKWGTGPLEQGWEWLSTEGVMPVFQGVPYDTLNTLAAVFALVLVWPVFRKLGAAYAVFVLVNLVPPIFAGGALSMGRVTSTVFPIFLALAALVPGRAVPGWVATFALLQGFVAAIFFTWRELF